MSDEALQETNIPLATPRVFSNMSSRWRCRKSISVVTRPQMTKQGRGKKKVTSLQTVTISTRPGTRAGQSPATSERSGSGAGGPRSVRPEDVSALMQDELHHLVLEHHGHGHATFLRLGPQQRGPEHDGHALYRHAVLLPVLDHPGGRGEPCRDECGRNGGPPRRPLSESPLPSSPAQVLEEQPERVVVGGRQGAHQVTHTAAALSLVL